MSKIKLPILLAGLYAALAGHASAQTRFENIQNFGCELAHEAAVAINMPSSLPGVKYILAGNNDGIGLRAFVNTTENGDFSDSFREITSQLFQSSIAHYITHIIAADLNNDGYSDLVYRMIDTTGGASAPAQLGLSLFNPTTQKFQAETLLTGTNMSVPVTADINSDGRKDIIAAGTSSSTAGNAELVAYLQNTQGGFGAPITLSSLGASPLPNEIPASVIDFDNDGDADILLGIIRAAAGGYDTTPTIAVNNGGQFTTSQIGVLQGIRSEQIITTDIDSNGTLDSLILLSNSAFFSGTYAVLSYHYSNGSWQYSIPIPNQNYPLPSVRKMGVVDYNGDNRKDILIVDEFDEPRLFSQNSSGTFNDISSSAFGANTSYHSSRVSLGLRIAPPLITEDLNADGVPDILLPRAASGAALLIGNGYGFIEHSNSHGVLQRQSTIISESIEGFCAGKLVNSAVSDLVLLGESSTFFARGNGTGDFSQFNLSAFGGAPTTPKDCAVIDLDGDGDQDVVIAGAPADVAFTNSGAGAFIANSSLSNANSNVVSAINANGDSRSDLFFGGVQAARVTLNLPQGLIDIPIQVTAGSKITKGVSGDIDGDGANEIIMLEEDAAGLSSAVLVDLNLQNLTSSRSLVFPGIVDISVADFNSDGLQDLALVASNGQVAITSANSSYSPIISSIGISKILVGDFNGDASPDIILTPNGSTSGQAQLLTNDTHGNFQVTLLDTGLAKIGKLLSIDTDLDGDLDIIASAPTARGLRTRILANQLRQIKFSSFVRIGSPGGSTIRATFASANSSAVAFLLASLSPLTQPLPTPWGYLSLSNFVSGPTVLIPVASSTVDFTFNLPYFPSLIGQQMTVQAAFLDQNGDIKLSSPQSIGFDP